MRPVLAFRKPFVWKGIFLEFERGCIEYLEGGDADGSGAARIVCGATCVRNGKASGARHFACNGDATGLPSFEDRQDMPQRIGIAYERVVIEKDQDRRPA